MMTRRTWLAVALFTATMVSPAAAQMPLAPTSPQFQEVVRLDQEGKPDSARALIAAKLSAMAPTDSDYPEALYTAAIVAKTGDETRRDYIRITVEYPQSHWADKALLRLAQLDYGTGNLDGVEQKVTRLFTDYPISPILPSAALWGARAAFERQHIQQACTWLDKGLSMVGDNIELKNQLTFAKQRCTISPGVEVVPQVADSLRAKPPAPDTTKRPAPDTARPISPPSTPPLKRPPSPKPAVAETGTWRVQVAAISNRAAIDRLVNQLKDAGYKTYQLSGPHGLTRIQVGPYATREQASAQIAKLKKLAGGTPYPVQMP
jgi:cell division septation protein DedD